MRAFFSHFWKGSSEDINKWNQWLLEINYSLDLWIPWLILSGMSTLSSLFIPLKKCSHVLAAHGVTVQCVSPITYTCIHPGMRPLWAKVENELLGISVPMTGTTNLMIHSALEEKNQLCQITLQHGRKHCVHKSIQH